MNNAKKYTIRCGNRYVRFNLDGSIINCKYGGSVTTKEHMRKLPFDFELAVASGIIVVEEEMKTVKKTDRGSKAYSEDVILVHYEDGTHQKFTVEERLSDTGKALSSVSSREVFDCVIATSGERFLDSEYKLIEKVNPFHSYKRLRKILEMSDDDILQDFMQGSMGRWDFKEFMKLVRALI